MAINTVDSLLKEHKLKKTRLRVALLNCILQSKHAQSYLDLKRELGEPIDKSTLYRNLHVFEEAGIIHHINDQSGLTKYAFGQVHAHGRNHAHFVCEKCETVFCVKESTTIDVQVPEGFKTKNIQTIIRGTCDNC